MMIISNISNSKDSNNNNLPDENIFSLP